MADDDNVRAMPGGGYSTYVPLESEPEPETKPETPAPVTPPPTTMPGG